MKTINLVWWNGLNFLFETEWINSLLSDFEVNHIVNPETLVDVDNAIIIANLTNTWCTSQGRFKFLKGRKKYKQELKRLHDHIKRINGAGIKIGLFHVGDEFYSDSTEFYQDVDFVFRNFYKEEVHRKYANCYYFPLGYQSSFSKELTKRTFSQKQYLWSFVGTLKGSRYEMIKHAKDIAGGKCCLTNSFNDRNTITTEEYAALLSDTKFSLCPSGNFAVETCRLYESLEAGAIPILEAQNFYQAITSLLNPLRLLRDGSRDHKYWLRNYQYWERAFSEDFPCPLIYNWKDLEELISSIDMEKTSEKIQLWWKEYKQSVAQLVKLTVEDAFF